MSSISANVPQERVQLPGRLPLSRAMVSLLASLIRAIDTRTGLLDDAQEEDWDSHVMDVEPETCEACGGTGFILVPSSVQGNIDDDGVDDAVPVPPQAPPSQASVAIQAPPVTDACTAGLTSEPALAPTRTEVPQSEATCSLTSTSSEEKPSTSHLPSSSDRAGSVEASSVPIVVPAVPPVVAVATQPIINIPPASVPIRGYNPLGPNTPAPHPTNAVYCSPGADRYYCVTRGIRVGVYSGWQNTSPYVTGVASASYSRHRSIHAAYDAYCSAYYAGFVTYA
ncbi:hypothetical protein NMY22_g4448 [Coprinellus aureogranulatus]|nr:hypothetical protein NMY22_g4448 [Coprinellus aureogranulatus]